MTDRTHVAVIQAIPADARARLTERRDGPGLLRLGVQLGLIAALGTAIVAGAPGWPALLLPQGILTLFLFPCLHEAIHGTAFRSAWLNRSAAWLAGFATLNAPGWFRAFHLAHHRHTQDPARDPELARPLPRGLWPTLAHVSGLPTWIGQVRVLVRHAMGQVTDPFVAATARTGVVREARVMLAGYGLLALGSLSVGSGALIWAWIVPALLGQPFLRLYLMAEHGRCAFVENMLENSRTTVTNRAVRWIAWNMPYHTEHHSFPAVPFHALPALHEHIKGDLKVTAPGYAALHRSWLGA